MEDINPKNQFSGTLPVPEDEVHTAPEYNDRRDELQNSVADADLALDAADTHQLSKAMFGNAVRAQSMLDNSVAANAVELTPISGSSKLRLPTPVAPDYSALNGAIFSFKAANTNTGNMTVNVGQTVGTLIGVKSLFLADGSTEVFADGVVSGRYYSIRYDPSLDGGSGAFVIIQNVPKALLAMANLSDQLNGVSSLTKVDFGSIVKQRNISVSSNEVTLKEGVLYRISYSIRFVYVSGTTPQTSPRFTIVSGDSSWIIESMTIATSEVDAATSVDTLFSSCLIQPNVDTVIDVQLSTQSGSQIGKITLAALTVIEI